MAGDGGAGAAAVFLFDDLTELFDGHLATAYLEEGAYDGAHHVAQEAVGLDNKAPLVLAHLLPSGLHDATIVGGHIGVELAEAGEVNVVEEMTGGLSRVHGRGAWCDDD